MCKATPSNAVHLVVLQHGLWGQPQHVAYVEKLLLEHVKQRAGDEAASKCEVRSLNSDVNKDKTTYDGIDFSGDRLVALIKKTIASIKEDENKTVLQLSFIGYSLGGLICRYATGILHAEGWFEQSGIEPVNFITVATPHLGAYKFTPSSFGISALYSRAFNRMVPIISSRLGYQLMLKDKHAFERPLLMNLADQSLPFFQGLQRFPKLMLLANIHYDNMVHYKTAAISTVDPYEGQWQAFGESKCRTMPGAHPPEKYPSVVKPCTDPLVAPPERVYPKKAVYIFFGILPLLLPIALMLLLVGSVSGICHFKTVKEPDYSWIQEYRPRSTDGKGKKKKKGAGAQQLVEGAEEEGEEEEEEGAAQERGGEEAGAAALAKGEQPSYPEAIPPSPEALSSFSSSSPPPPVVAAAPKSIEEKYEFITSQLNVLPWHKVEVDVGHRHSHAAIVLRTPSRFKNQDHLEYMFEQMIWS